MLITGSEVYFCIMLIYLSVALNLSRFAASLSDINECNEARTSCPYNSYCRNTERSYECICNKGYEMRGNRCVRKVTSCGIGYEVKNGRCQGESSCTNVLSCVHHPCVHLCLFLPYILYVCVR